MNKYDGYKDVSYCYCGKDRLKGRRACLNCYVSNRVSEFLRRLAFAGSDWCFDKDVLIARAKEFTKVQGSCTFVVHAERGVIGLGQIEIKKARINARWTNG